MVALHHKVDEWLNGHALDVEDAAARLPAKLRQWQAELRAELPGHEDVVRGQLWLCGWKPTTRTFAGWHMSSDVDFEPDELRVPSTSIAPGAADVGYVPPAIIDDPSKLISCCAVQKQMADAELAAGRETIGIGGEVLLVELTKDGFHIAKKHRFSDYHATRELLRADAG